MAAAEGEVSLPVAAVEAAAAGVSLPEVAAEEGAVVVAAAGAGGVVAAAAAWEAARRW